MVVYHGSKNIIELPLYGEGKPHNDFGRGFYCTENIDLSKEWAVRENRNGFSNSYFFNEKGLSVLNLNDGDYIVLNWLAILITHRSFEISLPMPKEIMEYICENFYIDVDSYDIVRGCRADDSYFSFAKDFLNGTISYRQLSNALYLGGLGEQIVIKSKKAFQELEFKGYSKVLAKDWYNRKSKRDSKARQQYFDMRLSRDLYGEIFALDILREGMKTDDPRLR